MTTEDIASAYAAYEAEERGDCPLLLPEHIHGAFKRTMDLTSMKRADLRELLVEVWTARMA